MKYQSVGKRYRSLTRDRRGTAALEFAMVMPLMMLFLFGIIGSSLYLSAQIAVEAAASEGARASVAGLSSTERASLAQSAALTVLQHYQPLLVPANASVSAQPSASNGSMFQVTVNYTLPSSALAQLVPLPSAASFTSSMGNGGY